jgi:hypothetical protein
MTNLVQLQGSNVMVEVKLIVNPRIVSHFDPTVFMMDRDKTTMHACHTLRHAESG